MTAQLSRERLEEIALEVGDAPQFIETLEMARMLLAGMDSEPVCRISAIEKANLDNGTYAVVDIPSRHTTDMPLYAAPPVAVPDDWRIEAERLAELHGASFVIFRHGEQPVCADPTKFWFGYDPAAPEQEV